MSLDQPMPPFPLLRGMLWTGALAVLGLTLATGVLAVFGLWGHVLAAGAGAGVALLGGWLSLLPMARARGGSLPGAAMLAMAGTGIRLLVTVGGGVGLVMWLGVWAAVWTLGWYVLLTVVEVVELVRYFQAVAMSRGGSPAAGEDEVSRGRAESPTC